MISSLEVTNFRCFRQLKVEGLKQFNIVVGDSASGKTAFLESIFLLGGASPEIWMRIRQWRGYGNVVRLTGTRASYESIFREIFFDFRKERGAYFKLTETNGGIRALNIRYANQDRYTTLPVKERDEGRVENAFLVEPITFIWKLKNREYKAKVEYKEGALKFSGFDRVYPAWFSSPAINDAATIAPFFSELSLKKKSGSLVRAVNTLFPYVQDISLESIGGEPTLCVSIDSVRERLPIGSISSGLNKFLSVMVAIAANPGGVMLIDEFEVGFYYKLVPKLMEGIFSFCEEHQVQIIATTHSYEFLQALLPMMKSREGTPREFVLLRAERKESDCVVRVLGEPSAAIESNFEVR